MLHCHSVQQVLMIRHGESEWNAQHRWQGWADIALTPKGEADAAHRGGALAREGFRPRAVYSSDLVRAARTAEIIGAHLDVPVLSDFGFRERNVGAWSGLTTDEIEERWPGAIAQWRSGRMSTPPGGEADAQILERFDAAFLRALAHVGTGMLGIVSHGGVVRLVATRAGADAHTFIPNLGGFWFDVDDDGALRNPISVDTLHADAERPSIE
jgi:glucosyl-3-phosphoglycerate phosphatase